MRPITIVAVTAALLCLPVPATAQGFQFGSEHGSKHIPLDTLPCYRWSSHSGFWRFHGVDHWPQKAHVDRSKFYPAERNWDAGTNWLGPRGKRRIRCIGLWESQR